MSAPDHIEVRGARTHNLRDVDADIPIDRCTAIVGPSGSGKSSLGFGTVHAAAHAAFLEGISSYSRGTEARLAEPEVDSIRGLRPSLALAQGYGGRSSRSTVGTVTEVAPLLRLAFSRMGTPTVAAGDLSPANAVSRCSVCGGAGTKLEPVENRIVDPHLTLEEGAIRHKTWKVGSRYWNILVATGAIPLDIPAAQLSAEQRELLLYAPPREVANEVPGFVQRFTYEGIVPRLRKRIGDSRGLDARSYDLTFFDEQPCPGCRGTRLASELLAIAVGDVTFEQVITTELLALPGLISQLDGPAGRGIAARLLPLLGRLENLGLGHLTVDRPTNSLSGGELRRLRIAHQLASSLVGLVYVGDEIGAGLHPEEAAEVYRSLVELRDDGNTVILIDHSELALEIADHLIEMGPGGGSKGGQVVWAGPAAAYQGRHGRRPNLDRALRPVGPDHQHLIVQARSHNLVPAAVRVPIRRFVVLAGPSGSGKSSLGTDLAAQIPGTALLSQRDIGGSPRSVIATYLGVFDRVRKLYAKASGRPAADFTFNGAGACPDCGGWGYLRMEMQFLEDVVTPCERCQGRRYRPEVTAVVVDGRSIDEVLALTVSDAAEHFSDRSIRRHLDVAVAVGIGHLVLGQSTDTLSGGEAQRLRIAAEVAAKEFAVAVFDEPSRGLGGEEVVRLIALIDDLVGSGRSVIAIEHNPWVMAVADWIIELGPGAGSRGGRVVGEGSPAEIAALDTLTARTLRRIGVGL